MAVRIRMKKMGRRHRPFYRICAVDGRRPRGGRVLEELGTYDPIVTDVDARTLLNAERVNYWLGVGAQPSDKVRVLIKKYGGDGTHLEAQRAARERLAMPRVVPEAGKPAYVPPAPKTEAPPAPAVPETAAEPQPAAEAAPQTATENEPETPEEAAVPETPAEEAPAEAKQS